MFDLTFSLTGDELCARAAAPILMIALGPTSSHADNVGAVFGAGPAHEQHLAFVGAVIETGAPFRQRCVRDVERAFDGPRGTRFDAGRLVLGVHAQIQKMFETKTRC
jgi:hypothetical protein